MQGKPIQDVAAENDQMDFMVLKTIIDPCLGLGLVHKLGEFVFPTRAAMHAHAIQ